MFLWKTGLSPKSWFVITVDLKKQLAPRGENLLRRDSIHLWHPLMLTLFTTKCRSSIRPLLPLLLESAGMLVTWASIVLLAVLIKPLVVTVRRLPMATIMTHWTCPLLYIVLISAVLHSSSLLPSIHNLLKVLSSRLGVN